MQIICAAQGDLPPHSSFQWAFHGRDAQSQRDIQVTRISPKTSLLTIPELDMKHSGTYSCSISDEIFKNIELFVNGRESLEIMSHEPLALSLKLPGLRHFVFILILILSSQCHHPFSHFPSMELLTKGQRHRLRVIFPLGTGLSIFSGRGRAQQTNRMGYKYPDSDHVALSLQLNH